MGRKYLYLLGLIAVFAVVSCAKERGPTLIVHVQEVNGYPAAGATVHAWPGADATDGIVKESMDQTLTTDAAGDVVFEFELSAVLDLDVYYIKELGLDSLLNPVYDTLIGTKVTKVEAKRQRSSENKYNETVTVE